MMNDGSDGEWRVAGTAPGEDGSDLENCVPSSVRPAQMARKRREELWPWVWMSFASVVILLIALAILAYRISVHHFGGAQIEFSRQIARGYAKIEFFQRDVGLPASLKYQK